MTADELRQRAQVIIETNRQCGGTDEPDPDTVDAVIADAVALAEGVLSANGETVHLATGARITVDINGCEVSVIHETDCDGGHYLQLQGQNCDLSGEMPGMYYPEPRQA